MINPLTNEITYTITSRGWKVIIGEGKYCQEPPNTNVHIHFLERTKKPNQTKPKEQISRPTTGSRDLGINTAKERESQS